MFIHQFLEKVWEKPENFDFKAVLEDFIHTKEYDPYADVGDLRKTFSEKLRDNHFEEIITSGMKILEIKPFDIEIHALLPRFISGRMTPKNLICIIISRLLCLTGF